MSAATTHDLTAEEAEQLAGALLNAFEAGEPLEPITAVRPGLAVEGAYRIQRALIAGHA